MNKNDTEPKKCACNCCEEELKDGCFEPAFCTPCEVVFTKCSKCGAKISDKVKICSACGQKQ